MIGSRGRSSEIRALLDQERAIPAQPAAVRARAMARARAALAAGAGRGAGRAAAPAGAVSVGSVGSAGVRGQRLL